MTEDQSKKPPSSAGGKRAPEIRRKRLADALRANLGRRKAQARERDASSGATPGPPSSSRGEG